MEPAIALFKEIDPAVEYVVIFVKDVQNTVYQLINEKWENITARQIEKLVNDLLATHGEKAV